MRFLIFDKLKSLTNKFKKNNNDELDEVEIYDDQDGDYDEDVTNPNIDLSSIDEDKTNPSMVMEDLELEQLEQDEDHEQLEVTEKNKILLKLEKELPILFKLINKIKPERKTSTNNKENLEPIEVDSEEKPKRKIKIIHILIVLILLALLMEDFLVEQPAPPAPKLKPIKKIVVKKKVKPEVLKPKINEPIVEAKPEPVFEPEPKKDIEPVEEIKENDISDIDFDTDTDTDTDTDVEIDNKPLEEPPVSDTQVGEVKTEDKESEKVESPSLKTDETIEDKDTVSLPDIPNLSLNENLNSDINIDETDSKMTEMILKQLEKENDLKDKLDLKDVVKPKDPPHYLSSGKNLVYNCVDGHWACVDDSDYKICQSHYAYNKKNDKPTSCFPERDYESQGECSAVQQYKINTIVNTDFCN